MLHSRSLVHFDLDEIFSDSRLYLAIYSSQILLSHTIVVLLSYISHCNVISVLNSQLSLLADRYLNISFQWDIGMFQWTNYLLLNVSESLQSLVSTYVVCERLSVMHEPAGVVEVLVQILQNTPYSEIQFQNTPPKKWKLSESPSLRVSEYTPPLENWNLGRSWHLMTFSVSEYLPPQKLKFRQILLGTLRLFSFRIPPLRKLKFRQILAL